MVYISAKKYKRTLEKESNEVVQQRPKRYSKTSRIITSNETEDEFEGEFSMHS